jgi:ribosomal protein L10
MKFGLKNYKLKKNLNYLKKKPLLFIFNISNLTSKSWIKIEQAYKTNNIKYFKVYNNLSKKAFECSIFKNMTVILNGPICLVYLTKMPNLFFDLKKLIKLNSSMLLIGVKLNTKVYSFPQITNICSFNYNKNIKLFNNSLKQLLKLPYNKLGQTKSK